MRRPNYVNLIPLRRCPTDDSWSGRRALQKTSSCVLWKATRWGAVMDNDGVKCSASALRRCTQARIWLAAVVLANQQ